PYIYFLFSFMLPRPPRPTLFPYTTLFRSYPHYPIQIWDLGGLPWVVLGGEVVIEYALKIKEIFGNPTFVMGYSNDMMAYIPSLKVLKEGGYEGARSQIYFKGMSKVWESKQEYYTA